MWQYQIKKKNINGINKSRYEYDTYILACGFFKKIHELCSIR